jgi:hypothetical protein
LRSVDADSSLKTLQKRAMRLTKWSRRGKKELVAAKEASMDRSEEKRPKLSLDWWTVIVGAVLAVAVLAGLPALPW